MIDNTVMAAIIGAIAAGALDGTKELAKSALSDGYNSLKATLLDRFGNKADLAGALEKVEEKPTSEGRMRVLEEELAESGAAKDHTLLTQAVQLIDMIKHLQGNTGSQIAHGTGIAQADRGSTASVAMNRNDK